jgi:hypothetical protein
LTFLFTWSPALGPTELDLSAEKTSDEDLRVELMQNELAELEGKLTDGGVEACLLLEAIRGDKA